MLLENREEYMCSETLHFFFNFILITLIFIWCWWYI